jgi:hypothetical protein
MLDLSERKFYDLQGSKLQPASVMHSLQVNFKVHIFINFKK